MSHSHKDIFEDRKQFQLERMILFSDAVFAIAITLLVIEIKVPAAEIKGEELTAMQLKHMLAELIPHFIGYLMSFAIVATFWVIHHRVFGFITSYNNTLIWLNMLLLCTLAVLPFSTSLVSEHGGVDFAYAWYSINLGLIGLSSYFIISYVSKPSRGLSIGFEDKRFRKYMRQRSFWVALIFFLGAILCLFNSPAMSWISRFIFVLIFPVLRIIKVRYNKGTHKLHAAGKK